MKTKRCVVCETIIGPLEVRKITCGGRCLSLLLSFRQSTKSKNFKNKPFCPGCRIEARDEWHKQRHFYLYNPDKMTYEQFEAFETENDKLFKIPAILDGFCEKHAEQANLVLARATVVKKKMNQTIKQHMFSVVKRSEISDSHLMKTAIGLIITACLKRPKDKEQILRILEVLHSAIVREPTSSVGSQESESLL